MRGREATSRDLEARPWSNLSCPLQSRLQFLAHRTIRDPGAPMGPGSSGTRDMLSDIEIARAAKLKPIGEIAARIGAPESALSPYGRSIAKLDPEFLQGLAGR